MATRQTMPNLRYVVNADGERTDVVIPLATWRKLLLAWRELADLQEEQDDVTILRDWLDRRGVGEVTTVSLDEFERELIADGLLPG